MLYSLDGHAPVVAPGCFIAPNAAVIGNVTFGEDASVWFSVTIRADKEHIVIGAETNVQDGAVLHADPGFPLLIGSRVTVGHLAMLHGCTVGDGSLVGINAVVLNGAVIGAGCLIAANALVTEGMQVPDGAVVMGSPGKVLRVLEPERRRQLEANAVSYVDNARRFRVGLRPVVEV
jgi:carbonic anhydrase/acetyltransferase-like protein (isoleucine patch superfamily)